MAGFEVTLHGRIWVTPEVAPPCLFQHRLKERIGDIASQ
jgi:hypothetical protein